jgi:polyhydroxyalkanoate synthase subunit PhaC
VSPEVTTIDGHPYAVVTAALVLLLALAAWGFVRLRATSRRRIRTGVVPGWRTLRTTALRAVLWFLSWPHVVDRALGTHRVPTSASPSFEIVRWPGGRLLHYPASGIRRGAPVLLVHSLVTQPWILDLAPGCSLVESLTASGRDVYLLDWGHPERATVSQGLLDKAGLVHAARSVAAGADAAAVHVVGYCSGATVALLATAMSPEQTASLSLIAPMVDASPSGGMQTVMGARWLLPPLLLDGHGCVPAAAVRESFHLLRPMALRAARQRWRMRHDPAATRIAAALTRWTWEQRPLAGGVFFDLVDMFRANPFMGDGWPAGSTTVDLRNIRTPTLVAVSSRDHIVPVDSSLAVLDLLQGPVEVASTAGGHVSMIAGLDAHGTLYPRLAGWLDRHDDPRVAADSVRPWRQMDRAAP